MPTGGVRPMAVAEEVLDLSTADATEVVVTARSSGLTRFAASVIHQNVYEEDAVLLLRVVVDGRVAGVRTNRLASDGLRRAVEDAIAIARATPPDPAFPGLPDPQPVPPVEHFAQATAQTTPVDRAARVRSFVQICGTLQAAGALETESHEVVVANSRGVRAQGRATQASFVSVVDGGDATSYVEAYDADVRRLPVDALGHRAVGRVELGRAPRDVPPGRYTVILEPEAVALMMNYLGFTVFNGKAVQEGRSFLTGKIGEKIVDERISLWDDATDPRAIGLPFDFEGVPKRKVMLIDRGVARSAAHDSRTAKQAATESTGHALPQPNAWGPMPANLFLSTGDASVEQMVASTERGLLVTRFHYVRVVDPLRTIITGMTRDGTFLIEDGRIVGGTKNLRFNQSMIDTLANVEAIGAESQLASESFIGRACAPALKVRDFNFTGTTTF